MNYELAILRRPRGAGAEKSYVQHFLCETDDPLATIASALDDTNARDPILDAAGNAAAPIRWDCGCLQKKCGACAMVIDGKPRLACDARLAALARRGAPIRVEPLRKFPVIEDLMVDRSAMMENLTRLRVWMEAAAKMPAADGEAAEGLTARLRAARADRRNDRAYEASRCLQCGCCLEICPNFDTAGAFAGTAAAVPLARLLAKLPKEALDKTAERYRKDFFEGCGKSLACRAICPAGIGADELLAASNAAALWRSLLSGRRAGRSKTDGSKE